MRYFRFLSLLFLCFISVIYADKKGDVTDPQKPIVVKSSQPTFALTLSSNPTTGYAWFLKSYDTEIIKPLGKKFYPAKSQSKLLGAGGYEVWNFMVKPNGFTVPQTTNITLIYTRPWELQGAQVNNFKVVTSNDS